MNTLADEINRCRYLYLGQISEPQDNSLRILIAEARGSGMPEDVIIAGVLVTGTQPIISDESCAAFELVWDTYVAYSVRNESFVSGNDYEQFEGRLFCVYSVSHYLDYIRKDTFADPAYPGPFQHYGINCLNHIIDIVSIQAPRITKVRSRA
jgi:hypothetical protein